ncbi:ComF family protein [Haloactinomyces albus]|uniref:Amidophosphoribosyltransferase n=1 Tax=Haloactinomyces albus TaxID=1352928 RepID=A0AAE4CLF3_9ACTN|nr:ComF family protein [Haloactinomyces albus]MDR7301286.1 putative amidophosphoribosyltransferase [Haloactinomyces albus]
MPTRASSAVTCAAGGPFARMLADMDVIGRGRTVRHSIAALVDLLLPLCCAGCGAAGSGWCTHCHGELRGLRRVERPLLGPDPPAYALGRYRGAARSAVLAYKESGRRDLAVPFGHCMAAALDTMASELGAGESSVMAFRLVPAPSRVSMSRRRGGAHMTRIGRWAASALTAAGRPVAVADCLALSRGTRDSVGLGSAERVRNLSGRVLLRTRRLPPSCTPVVLLDDVITTGATAVSCVRALESAGVRVAAVLALTATAR